MTAARPTPPAVCGEAPQPSVGPTRQPSVAPNSLGVRGATRASRLGDAACRVAGGQLPARTASPAWRAACAARRAARAARCVARAAGIVRRAREVDLHQCRGRLRGRGGEPGGGESVTADGRIAPAGDLRGQRGHPVAKFGHLQGHLRGPRQRGGDPLRRAAGRRAGPVPGARRARRRRRPRQPGRAGPPGAAARVSPPQAGGRGPAGAPTVPPSSRTGRRRGRPRGRRWSRLPGPAGRWRVRRGTRRPACPGTRPGRFRVHAARPARRFPARPAWSCSSLPSASLRLPRVHVPYRGAG